MRTLHQAIFNTITNQHTTTKMANTDTVKAQLKFLRDSSYLMSTASPATSAFLGSQLDKLFHKPGPAVYESEKTQAARRREMCGYCGNILIPGWSYEVRHQKTRPTELKKGVTKESKVTENKQRQLVYRCNRCYCETVERVFHNDPKPAFKKQKAVQKAIVTEKPQPSISLPPKATPAPFPQPSSNSSSKKRQKARKGGLQALVAKSKAEAAAPAGGFGLDLMDLMKSD